MGTMGWTGGGSGEDERDFRLCTFFFFHAPILPLYKDTGPDRTDRRRRTSGDTWCRLLANYGVRPSSDGTRESGFWTRSIRFFRYGRTISSNEV